MCVNVCSSCEVGCGGKIFIFRDESSVTISNHHSTRSAPTADSTYIPSPNATPGKSEETLKYSSTAQFFIWSANAYPAAGFEGDTPLNDKCEENRHLSLWVFVNNISGSPKTPKPHITKILRFGGITRSNNRFFTMFPSTFTSY